MYLMWSEAITSAFRSDLAGVRCRIDQVPWRPPLRGGGPSPAPAHRFMFAMFQEGTIRACKHAGRQGPLSAARD